jgi:hypothetical protein
MVMCTIESINEIYKDFTLLAKGKDFTFSLKKKTQENKDLQQIQECGDSLTRLLLGWLLAGRYGSQSYIH